MPRLRPALLLAALCACQGYNVDPVQPRAIRVADAPVPVEGHRLPPNLMLVVDRSGSFTDGSDGTPYACANTRGAYTGDRGQDCKWNNLLDAMLGPPGSADGGFLAQLDGALQVGGDRARLGLVTYSDKESGNDCAAGRLRVAIPTAAVSTAADIRKELLATTPAGATPTAATMATLPGRFPPAEVGRDNYAILLTDGAPNCNAGLAATQAACGGDRCTISGGCGGWDTCSCNPAVLPRAAELCLDDDALVSAVAALAQAGIKTFVIGFGADTSRGSAHDTLNRAAQAGGVPNTTQPGFDYFQATTLGGLNQALLTILGTLTPDCTYTLDSPPASDRALQVVVTAPGAPACASDADCPAGLCAGPEGDRHCGRELAPAELKVEGTQVTVLGDACQTLGDATPASPARIEFRYVAR